MVTPSSMAAYRAKTISDGNIVWHISFLGEITPEIVWSTSQSSKVSIFWEKEIFHFLELIVGEAGLFNLTGEQIMSALKDLYEANKNQIILKFFNCVLKPGHITFLHLNVWMWVLLNLTANCFCNSLHCEQSFWSHLLA